MRINIINPRELYDQHLLAEIRELKMLPKLLVRSLNSKNSVDFKKIQQEYPRYTLNKGHGKFFYNKLGFVEDRFKELLIEADLREYNLKEETRELYDSKYDYSTLSRFKDKIYCSYTPTRYEVEVNEERIRLRKSERENFYRYYGKVV